MEGGENDICQVSSTDIQLMLNVFLRSPTATLASKINIMVTTRMKTARRTNIFPSKADIVYFKISSSTSICI